MDKKRIGEILVEEKLITKDQLHEALKIQKSSGEPIGQILVKAGYVDALELAMALSKQFAETQPEDKKQGRCISFLAMKGGCGSSFLSLNMAMGLADAGQKVCLVDFNLAYPNLHLYLNQIKPAVNLDSVLALPDPSNKTDIISCLVSVSDNLSFLAGTSRFKHCDKRTTSILQTVINALVEDFEYVILDLNNNPDELILTMLDRSDQIIPVFNPSFAAITNTLRFLEMLKRSDFTDERVFPVLNSYKDGDLPVADINKYFPYPVKHKINYDPTSVQKSLNKAKPLIRNMDSGRLYSELAEMINLITDRNLIVSNDRSGFWDKLIYFRQVNGEAKAS